MLWGRCITIREHLDERNQLIVKGDESLASRGDGFSRIKEGLRKLAAMERQFKKVCPSPSKLRKYNESIISFCSELKKTEAARLVSILK